MSRWDAVGAGGLGLPEPPGALAAQVVPIDDESWGTRAGAPSLRGLAWFEQEFLDGRNPGDYVLASREDAATNLPAVQYALVHGRLGLFLAVGRDERGRRALATAGELQDRALLALADGPLLEGKLAVLHHQWSTRRWTWTGPGETGGIDGLDGALDWLLSR